MEVNGQFHFPDTLSLQKEPLVTIEEEAEWAPEQE
jgi:hypothetical protein